MRLRAERDDGRLLDVLEAVRLSGVDELVGGEAELVFVGFPVVRDESVVRDEDAVGLLLPALFDALVDLTLRRVTYESLTKA